MGWLEGFEPSLKAPQASVLPLHHSHHIFYFAPGGNRTLISGLEVHSSIH